MAGDVADFIGRRNTIVIGCGIYIVGVILQIAAHGLGLIVAGRLVAGFGVGFESAIVILYMSEIVSRDSPKSHQRSPADSLAFQCPKKVRGALVAGYQFCITIGILMASGVDYAVKDRPNTGSYIVFQLGIQFAWGLILGGGLLFLPDSPRYFVKRGKIEMARKALTRLRNQPPDSKFVEAELTEIILNEEYERSLIPSSSWFASWANCFKGSGFQVQFEPAQNHSRHLSADDAAVDRCELHLLLLHTLPAV